MIDRVNFIKLPKIEDQRGKLSFIQQFDHIPFEIEDVHLKSYENYVENGYAYKNQHEIIISLSGSFDVVIKNKDEGEKKYKIEESYFALYIPSNTWRYIENHSPNAISLHLLNKSFNEKIFMKNFQDL
jgi:hypothetical protein